LAHHSGTHSSGGQTAVGVLAWWMMAMVLFPETQRRAHEELDRVVGRDRLPTLDDCDKLPYLQAMASISSLQAISTWRLFSPGQGVDQVAADRPYRPPTLFIYGRSPMKAAEAG